MKDQNTKYQKGITLIALIITIVILLILAVVTIGAVQEDGIIGKAKYARDEYEKAQAKENSILQGYLDQLNDNTLYGNGGYESNKEVYVNDYGAPIEYSVDLNDDGDLTNDWKVFYKDDTHWYIIASDYLNNKNLPTKLNMSTYEGYPYSAYWDWGFISENASTITLKVAEKYKLSWLEDNSSSANENARATADLLNVEAWTEKFGNAEKGIEAIGGPTLEMWIASWNEKGAELGTDKYVELKTEYDSIGYFVGPSTTESLLGAAEDGDEKSGGCWYPIKKSTDGYDDILYFPYPSSSEGCEAYWLASPSASKVGTTSESDTYLMCVWGRELSYGNLGYNKYYVDDNDKVYGVRPLVSVPSELIEKTSDGFRVVE